MAGSDHVLQARPEPLVQHAHMRGNGDSSSAKQELPCPGPRAGPGRAGQGADGVGVLRVRLVVLLSVAPHKVCPARLGRGRCVAITTKRAGRCGALGVAARSGDAARSARGASVGVHLASPRRRSRTARTRPSGVPATAQKSYIRKTAPIAGGRAAWLCQCRCALHRLAVAGKAAGG